MHFTKPTAFALMQTASVFAATKQVIVGPNGSLTFSPNTITAAVGDTVQFMFATQNHTVTSGNPSVGCTPSQGFNSGFVPAPGAATAATAAAPAAGAAKGTKGKGNKMIRGENAIYLDPRAAALPSFTVPIKSTAPITVYCAQAQHCQVGMVMVINPSTSGTTSLAAYQALCAKAQTNTPAKAVTGGTLANLVKPAAAAGATKAGAAKAGAAGTAGTAAAAAPAAGTAKKAKGAKKAKKAAGATGATAAGAAAAGNWVVSGN